MNIKLTTFLTDDLRLRHSKRSNKMTVTIDGQDYAAKTVSELVSIIDGHKTAFKSNASWQDFKSSASSELSDADAFYDKLPEILQEHITYILSNKSAASMKLEAKAEASAFNSFVKDLAEMPKIGFNSIDKAILSRFRYCASDACIYIKRDGKLKLIGKLESLKKDPTAAGLCAVVKEEIGRQWNERRADEDR